MTQDQFNQPRFELNADELVLTKASGVDKAQAEAVILWNYANNRLSSTPKDVRNAARLAAMVKLEDTRRTPTGEAEAKHLQELKRSAENAFTGLSQEWQKKLIEQTNPLIPKAAHRLAETIKEFSKDMSRGQWTLVEINNNTTALKAQDNRERNR